MTECIARFVRELRERVEEEAENGKRRTDARRAKKAAHDALLDAMRDADASCVECDDMYAHVRTYSSARALTQQVVNDAVRQAEECSVLGIQAAIDKLRNKRGQHVVLSSTRGRAVKELACKNLVAAYARATADLRDLRKPASKAAEHDVRCWLEDNGKTSQSLNLNADDGTTLPVIMQLKKHTKKARVTKDMLGGFIADAVRCGNDRECIARLLWQFIDALPQVEVTRVQIQPH